jgi:flagellar L-ring protein precursor FlgH
MNGTKTATTNTDKTNDMTQTVNQLFGLSPNHTQQDFGYDLHGNRTFRSNGTSAQRNVLTGTLAVTVARVLPNGNLVVRGEKSIGLNQGSEVIQFSGIVRAEDITPANTILSTQVADARISYRGRGVLDETNRQGWLGRFFNSPIWPF